MKQARTMPMLIMIVMILVTTTTYDNIIIDKSKVNYNDTNKNCKYADNTSKLSLSFSILILSLLLL